MNTRFYYALYNEAHGDDQVNIFQAGDYYVFTVADGVSECELGRVASVLACAAFEECFMERVVGQGGVDLEEVVADGVRRAGERLVNVKQILSASQDEGSVDLVIGFVKQFIESRTWLEQTPAELISKRVDGLRERLLSTRKSGEGFTFETTLGVAVFHNYRVYTAALGDVEMYLLRRNKLFPHYVTPRGGFIDSYLSSDRGVVGAVDIAVRRLERGDVFILASDGAYLSYAPPGKYPYTLFVNQLLKSIERGEDPAQQWLARLRKEFGDGLPDDFSLVIVKVE